MSRRVRFLIVFKVRKRKRGSSANEFPSTVHCIMLRTSKVVSKDLLFATCNAKLLQSTECEQIMYISISLINCLAE